MVLYEISKLRERTLGSSANTSQDSILNNFGAQAESRIWDVMKVEAIKQKKISALPITPLPDAEITQNLKDACTDLACAFYFRKQRNFEAAKQYKEDAKEGIAAFVSQLKTKQGLGMTFF